MAGTEDEIDLDRKSEYIDSICGGSFFTFICPACGKKHRPEYHITVLWPSKRIRFEVIPELGRGEFQRRKKDPPDTETLIGYPELADRIAVIRDNLEPAAIESLKYFLLLKAEETYPAREIAIWYYGSGEQGIEFHLHGIRDDEVAVVRTPRELYNKQLDDYRKHPQGEIFAALRIRTCLSVQNLRRPEESK
jgi:hypothetical protein